MAEGTYQGKTRLEFLEITLAAIAPMCAKRITEADVDATAQLLHRSFRREPEADVEQAIDAHILAVQSPQALPTSGQLWYRLNEVRRRRGQSNEPTPTELFGGPAGAGAPMPGYLRELEAKLADVTRVDLPPHRHKAPGPGIDPTEGCLACEAQAERSAAVAALLDDLPDYQGMARSVCQGCDGSGWALVSGPDWSGSRVGKPESIWERCEKCNPIEGSPAVAS